MKINMKLTKNHHVTMMESAMQGIIVSNICGPIMGSMNLPEAAGNGLFAQALDHTGCLMKDKFNGSVVMIKRKLLMKPLEQ